MDKKILAIDADPAVGLSVALGVDVKLTLDDIRMSAPSPALMMAGHAMRALRSPIDRLELLVDKDYWPVPTYGDLMFEV